MGKVYKKIEKAFAANEVIFTENSECDGMYIIDKGRVRVYKTLDTPSGPRELELVQLGPRSMFGEMALIDDKKRSASIQAIEETRCTIITKNMFEDQLHDLPGWVVNLIRVLVARLRETNDKLREKAKTYHDDTGGLVIIDQKEGGYAKELAERLEGTMNSAEKKLKDIHSSIEDVRNKELKAINEMTRSGSGMKKKESKNDFSDLPGSVDEIEESEIREINENVSKLDKRVKKDK